jgi:hypothetical protein
VALALFYHRQNPQRTQVFFPRKFISASARWHAPCPPCPTVQLGFHKPDGGQWTARPLPYPDHQRQARGFTQKVMRFGWKIPSAGRRTRQPGRSRSRKAADDLGRTHACGIRSLDVKLRVEIPIIGRQKNYRQERLTCAGYFGGMAALLQNIYVRNN